MGLVCLSVVRGHEDKTYDICPSPWKSPRGKAYVEGQREAGTRARDLG